MKFISVGSKQARKNTNPYDDLYGLGLDIYEFVKDERNTTEGAILDEFGDEGLSLARNLILRGYLEKE